MVLRKHGNEDAAKLIKKLHKVLQREDKKFVRHG
jgi:hypothetical protein